MAFGGKMHDRVGLMLLEQKTAHQFAIADISLRKLVAAVVSQCSRGCADFQRR